MRFAKLMALLALVVVPQQLHAQAYPTRPIRIVVPVATGGIADYYSRVIGARMQEAWGQRVIVENRAGGGGNIGSDIVAKSAPDGYTMVMGFVGSHAVNPFLIKNMPYDPQRDFVPVAMTIEAEGMLAVHPSVPVSTVADLIAMAKAQPGKLSYASGGIGTASHLAGELFKSMTGTDIVHIPYKGNAPAIADLIGGQTQLTFATMPTVVPHVRAGKLRGVAVIGSSRSAAAPQLPTIAEAGVPGFSVNNWIGLFAPAGTPIDIVRKVNAEVMRIMRLPEVAKRMDVEGERFTPNTPEEFGAFVRAEVAKWGKVVKDAGLKAE
ncbi:MAG: tripartite tricarboxylate transporter substrate binding protein [Betaproteobacteria bacterium]|nr:tripartite tricarboxylate transporter substrate binding protein [Betaproteobacteria bacterium]